ncbi:TPA: hypothetical protein RQJ49_004495 [Vibrio vulnificus]|nr:hypothetical protein [Vibrio vulnificus]HDY7713149.1 hypothetical protein [Vibrio vulnificus]
MSFREKISNYKNEHLLGGEKIVFLDLCHWFRLLEDEAYSDLKELCLEEVEEGKLVFPVSFSIINEFQKHKDKELVLNRIQFADKLSKRFSILHYYRLPRREFVRYSNQSATLKKIDVLTHWFDFFPVEFNLIQNGASKEHCDILGDQLLDISPVEWLKYDVFWDMTQNINDKIYVDLRNIIQNGYSVGLSRNVIKNEELDSMVDKFISELVIDPNLSNDELAAIKEFVNKTPKTPEGRRKFFRNLPSLYMRSEVNTSLRYDKEKVKINDLWDLEHAITLPYTNIYVTDKPTAHTLKNTLKLERKFDVSILSSLEQLEEKLRA